MADEEGILANASDGDDGTDDSGGDGANIDAAPTGGDADGVDVGSGDDVNGADRPGDRPDNIPEQFWNAEKGEVRVDELAKSYFDIREAHNKLLNEKGGDVPEDVDGYFTDDNVKDDVFQVDGEVKNIEPIKSDDPALRHFAELAQSVGISPQQFTALASGMTVFADGLMPAPFDEAAELASLGDDGPKMASGLKAWANTLAADSAGELQLSDAEYNYLMAFGKPAIGIRVLNKIRASVTGGPVIPVDLDTTEEGLPSVNEWYAMKPDPRTDLAAYEKWSAMGEQIFGTGTSGGDIGRGVGVQQGHGAAQHRQGDDGGPRGRMSRRRVG